jgi:hypothetical protein
VRFLGRSRRPAIALAFLSPTIAEYLTGSTSATTLFVDPLLFLVQLAFLLALYGGGALLIREFAVVYRKGWATILLLGGAYGIAEEGLAVHTFFEPRGPPVNALATYGAAGGVDWLWVLAITVFHATYSIALPILLVQLGWPDARDERWLDRGLAVVVGLAYLLTVVVFAVSTPHGPTPLWLAVFVGLAAALVGLAYVVPADLLRSRPGPARLGAVGLGMTGALGFVALLLVYVLSGAHAGSAVLTGILFVAIDALALAIVLRGVGTVALERSELAFAAGMLAAESVFALLILPGDPAVALVIAGVAVTLVWLRRRIAGRSVPRAVPPGVLGS